MKTEAVVRLRQLLALLHQDGAPKVIDACVHLPQAGHTASSPKPAPSQHHPEEPLASTVQAILTDLDRAGVDMALLWPSLPCHPSRPHSPPVQDDEPSPASVNLAVIEAVGLHPDRLVPAAAVPIDRLGHEASLRLIDHLVLDLGLLLVRLDFTWTPTHAVLQACVERLAELGAIPAFVLAESAPDLALQTLEQLAVLHAYYPMLVLRPAPIPNPIPSPSPESSLPTVSARDRACHPRAATRDLALRMPSLRFTLNAADLTELDEDLITCQVAGEPFSENLFCASHAPVTQIQSSFDTYRRRLDDLAARSAEYDARLGEAPIPFATGPCRGYLGTNLAKFITNGCQFLLRLQRVP